MGEHPARSGLCAAVRIALSGVAHSHEYGGQVAAASAYCDGSNHEPRPARRAAGRNALLYWACLRRVADGNRSSEWPHLAVPYLARSGVCDSGGAVGVDPARPGMPGAISVAVCECADCYGYGHEYKYADPDQPAGRYANLNTRNARPGADQDA